MLSKQEVVAIARRLSKRYKSKWFASYTRIKVKTDPAYEAIFERLKDTDGPVLDIGCGLGLLGFYLAERGLDRPITGVDYNAKKIAAAQEIADRDYDGKLEFSVADARDGLPEFAGNVTILDILQYFDPDQQRELLQSAADRVASGGKLLVRSCLKTPGWRYRFTQVGDLFALVTFWMATPVHYPSEESIREALDDSGLVGEVKPLWGKTPFNNYLAEFRRP